MYISEEMHYWSSVRTYHRTSRLHGTTKLEYLCWDVDSHMDFSRICFATQDNPKRRASRSAMGWCQNIADKARRVTQTTTMLQSPGYARGKTGQRRRPMSSTTP